MYAVERIRPVIQAGCSVVLIARLFCLISGGKRMRQMVDQRLSITGSNGTEPACSRLRLAVKRGRSGTRPDVPAVNGRRCRHAIRLRARAADDHHVDAEYLPISLDMLFIRAERPLSATSRTSTTPLSETIISFKVSTCAFRAGGQCRDEPSETGNHDRRQGARARPLRICSDNCACRPGRLGDMGSRQSGLKIGAWRSLVAHLFWEQGVAGSNPAAPTISSRKDER